MNLIVGIMILAAASIILTAVGLTMKTERQLMLDRVRKYGFEQITEASILVDELAPSFTERLVRPALRKIGRIGKTAAPRESAQALQRRIATAGNPLRLSPLEFSALKGVSCVVGALAGLGVTAITQYGRSHEMLAVIIMTVAGYFAPERWLSSKIAHRKNKIQRDLPNAIDLLNVSLEAGLGFDAAVARIVDKTTGPLSDEFGRALEEMRMGKARVEALHSMADRTQVPELSGFVAAVYQAEELGASMTKVLRVQGAMIRSKRRMRAREIAAKLPVKMLFPLILFIFPSIFIVVLGPGAIQISRTLLSK